MRQKGVNGFCRVRTLSADPEPGGSRFKSSAVNQIVDRLASNARGCPAAEV